MTHSVDACWPQDRLDELKQSQGQLADDMLTLRNRIKLMSAQNQRIEEMMTTLLKAQGLEYQAEDVADT